MSDKLDDISKWSVEQVTSWLSVNGFSAYNEVFKAQKIDGLTFLSLSENDLIQHLQFTVLGDIRQLLSKISNLKIPSSTTVILPQDNSRERSNSNPIIIPPTVSSTKKAKFSDIDTVVNDHDNITYVPLRSKMKLFPEEAPAVSSPKVGMGSTDNNIILGTKSEVFEATTPSKMSTTFKSMDNLSTLQQHHKTPSRARSYSVQKDVLSNALVRELEVYDSSTESWSSSLTKLFVAASYFMISIFCSAFTMAVVHERIPNPTIYPPLPDIVLDNINRIPIAFKLAEVCAIFLFTFLSLIVFFHVHRLVILRRFFLLVGTVFLLRCATMFITSLAVPGKHLSESCVKTLNSTDLEHKLQLAFKITKGFGLSVVGVNTCGDYMFSGHTTMLTFFNFFLLEYTPNEWKGFHIITWMLNLFGMFFILAAHEHYSIDVFIAFYISSRLFSYYHTIANIHFSVKQMSGHDVLADAGYIPFFGYFEEHTRGVLENEYGIPLLGYRFYKSASSTDEDTDSNEK